MIFGYVFFLVSCCLISLLAMITANNIPIAYTTYPTTYVTRAVVSPTPQPTAYVVSRPVTQPASTPIAQPAVQPQPQPRQPSATTTSSPSGARDANAPARARPNRANGGRNTVRAIGSAGPSVTTAIRPTAGPRPFRERTVPTGPRRRRCPLGERRCEVVLFSNPRKVDRCFNPASHVCVDNLICPKYAPERCGDNCFSSNELDADAMICHHDRALCPIDLPEICGDDACYHPEEYKCVNGQLADVS